MRVIQPAITDVDHYIDEAQRATVGADFKCWRAELRPYVRRLFAARARTLTCRAHSCNVSARDPDHHSSDSPARLGPVEALASLDPLPRACGLDWALGRAVSRLLGDGREFMKDVRDTRHAMRDFDRERARTAARRVNLQ